MELFQGFSELSMAGKAYLGIAVFATALLIFQIILTGFGLGDHDVDHDFDHDLSEIEGITFFSVRSITAFACFFGWVGYICVRAGLWPLLSLLPALGAGLIAFFAVAFFLRLFYSLAESGTADTKTAVGEIGEVYLTIPEGKNQIGKVNVSIAGARREFNAITENGQEIKTGAKVRVSGTLDGNTLIVSELNQPDDWLETGI